LQQNIPYGVSRIDRVCVLDFNSVYQGDAPWDIGRPQKEFVHLEGVKGSQLQGKGRLEASVVEEIAHLPLRLYVSAISREKHIRLESNVIIRVGEGKHAE
jgi:hypothetical protein